MPWLTVGSASWESLGQVTPWEMRYIWALGLERRTRAGGTYTATTVRPGAISHYFSFRVFGFLMKCQFFFSEASRSLEGKGLFS